jgi:thioredoxin reductase (NADPH)
MQPCDVLIIGGGPAGLTAAIYTSRASLKTLVIAGGPFGSQLVQTTTMENFPGFLEGIIGSEFINNTREQAKKFGTEFVNENVTGILCERGLFLAQTESGNKYEGKCVIIATGASAKWLGLPSETCLRGKGVSVCATCDGFFFKDKVVAIVGGGDAAMEESTYLTKFATKVYVLVRGTKENMKASKIMQDRAFADPKIEFMFNTEVKEILGTEKVSGVKIVNNQTREEKTLSDVEGVFVAIGHTPNSSFLKGFVELDTNGYVKTVDNTKTSVPGVFVAGDVSDHMYRQAVTAAGFGCMAARDAQRFLAEK